VALLDVNALVALAWDSHVHHAAMREWFAAHGSSGWATCPITESGFVRVSSNPKALPTAIGISAARGVLTALRSHAGQRREYTRLFAEPANSHLAVARLRSPRATREWLARVSAGAASSGR